MSPTDGEPLFLRLKLMKKALITDEHSIVRIGLQQILAQRTDIESVVQAPSADETLETLHRDSFDIVIVGLSLTSDAGL